MRGAPPRLEIRHHILKQQAKSYSVHEGQKNEFAVKFFTGCEGRFG
jgi:hypothetical protein